MLKYPSYATPFPRRLMCASVEAGILAPTGALHLVATVAGQRRTLTGFPRCAPDIRALGHLCRSDIQLWCEYNTRRMGCQIRMIPVADELSHRQDQRLVFTHLL
jgi:hypothetical protein